MKYIWIFALLTVGPWAIAQKTVQQYPVFQTTGQSMWGGGSAPGLNMNFQIFPQYKVEVPFNTESFTKFRFSGLDFGAVLDGHVAFGVGPFEFDISGFTAGSIDVDYPAMVNMEVPDDNTFNPGETVVIRSGFQALPGATLKTEYPSADEGKIGLYMGMLFDASFGFRACFAGCTPRVSIVPPPGIPMPSPLYDEPFTFFEMSKTGLTIVCNNQLNSPPENPIQCFFPSGFDEDETPEWTISNGAFSGTLKFPDVETTSSLNGINLSASGSDPYVIPSVNIIELLGYIPPIKPAMQVIQGSFTQNIFPDATGTMRGITIEWALVSIDFNIPISQSQEFHFRPTIYTTLTFPDTVDYVIHSRKSGNIPGRGVKFEYEAGDSISVRFPCHYDFMDVYAQHRIRNRFSNKTFDNIALELDFAVFDFALIIDPYIIIPRVCIPIPFASNICIGPVGFPGATVDPPPLVDPAPITLVSQDFPPYFEDEWELGGFNVVDVPQPFRLYPRKRQTQFAVEHIACHGDSTGTIVTTIPDAVEPLKYEWSFGSTDPNPVDVPAGRHYVKVTDANGCEFIETVEILQPPAIDLQLDAGTIACAGGDTEIEVTGTGGTGALTYTWSTGEITPFVSGKTAGTYEVTATDGMGCSATTSLTLEDPLPLELGIAKAVDPSCAGADDGSIEIFVQGGTAPYRYEWSNGSSLRDQQFLEGDTYSIEVTDANGCTATDAVTLVEPTELEATLSKLSDVSCFGLNDGSLQVAVDGGTPPYQYRWYDSLVTLSETGATIAHLQRGNYAVEVTDSRGCRVVRKGQVTEPQSPLHADIKAMIGNCFNTSSGSLDLTVQGGTPPYTYQWSNGQTVEDLSFVPAGTYTVTVTDAQGCVYSNKARLTDPQPVRVHISREDVSCMEQADGQLTITSIQGGVPPYTVQWSTGESTETISDLPVGTYSVTVMDAVGCQVTESREIRGNEADCLFIPNAFSPNGDGTNDEWNIRNLDLYPGATVKVFNKWGMAVFESTNYDRPWDGKFNGKTLEPGTYYYVVDLRNGEAVQQGYLMILK